MPERAKPFPSHSNFDTGLNQADSGAAQSLHVGSAPMRKQLSNVANASPSSSISSSPRSRHISAVGSVSSQGVDLPSLSGLAGAYASNSSPQFGFLRGQEPADLPFAVGLGSGKTSGVIERTRKESLLGSSGVSVGMSLRYFYDGRYSTRLFVSFARSGTSASIVNARSLSFYQFDSSFQIGHRLVFTVVRFIQGPNFASRRIRFQPFCAESKL